MPPTSTQGKKRGKGGDARGSQSGASKRRQLTPESRPAPSPTVITRSRASEQSLPPQVGKRTASATDKSRGDDKSAKRRMKTTDAGSQEDAAASAPAATEEGSDAASQEDAAEEGFDAVSQVVAAAAAASSAASQEDSSTTSSPLRCPIMPGVIKSQDSKSVIYEPVDSAVEEAYIEEDEKYMAKLEHHRNLLTLSENWDTICLDRQESLPIQESAKDVVFEAAEAVLGISSYIDGKLLTRCSGLLIDWNKETQCGIILTSANLLCTKSPRIDLWSSPREYDPSVEVLVHLLDDTTVVKGKLLNYHPHYNIALFEVVVNMPTELLVCTELVDYGQEIFLIGRDEKLHLKCSHGRVKRVGPGLYDHHHYMYVNCRVDKFGSGGPAINTNGSVMGMVNPTPTAAFIPTSIIFKCLHMWKNFKCVPRLHLGLKLSPVKFLLSTHRDKLCCRFKISTGVIVEEVSEGSPAEKAGIKRGDVVRSLNGECFSTTVEVRVLQMLHLGLKLSPVKFLLSTHRDKLRCRFKISTGVIVEEVSEGSPAEKAGIKRGDVVRSLNGECFSTTVELEGILMRICEVSLGKGYGIGSNVDLAVDLFQIRKKRNCTKKLTLNVSEDVEIIAEGTYTVSARTKNSVDLNSGQEAPRRGCQ